MRRASLSAPLVALVVLAGAVSVGVADVSSQAGRVTAPRPAEPEFFREPIDVTPPDVRSDPDVHLDYDIVYVRAPRHGDDEPTRWGEIAHPARLEPGSDLMLLHPDGSEERLVAGGDGAVTDPYVSFDGEWVFYAVVQGLAQGPGRGRTPTSADIYKIHVKTRRVVQLTRQPFDLSGDGELNLGPCPLPGGRVAFVSSRNGFRSAKGSEPALQLFVMDDDGENVEFIGALNAGMALHPAVLTDGRIIFSSQESQGLRNGIMWGLWSINPDGTHWEPVISAFDPGHAFHFQAQLSDGSIVAEEYYNANNFGFGAYFKLPARDPDDYPAFGPAYRQDPRNPPLRFGRYNNGRPTLFRLGFSPTGVESLTRFATNHEGAADPSVLDDRKSPAVGKVTHPSGAPGNDLLTVWSPGPVNQQRGLKKPAVDGGLYLIKGGTPIDAPGEMRLIKNDPNYNEQWPRALVPYRRIYGIDEPRAIPALANDGRLAKALPEGTPFGLIGAASLYKRESYPGGEVPPGSVTATFAGGADRTGYEGLDPFNSSGNNPSPNWELQGADAGKYANADIHAIRIVALEPTTHPKRPLLFRSHASERMRILGEIPVRKLVNGKEPIDSDGNPDTSFLAKIPADLPFTFQMLDKDGMVLNVAQTWHQLRPGEVRTDCGGCHSHSQPPTPFAATVAGRPGYVPFDLTERTPLVTARSHDESGKTWDRAGATGLRYARGEQSVEYFRDIKPMLDRSCQVCHSGRGPAPAAGNLVLDDDTLIQGVPGTYFRLAMDRGAMFGYKPVIQNGTWRGTNASRYIRKFQSRRSLLVWKIFGRRTDGWANDDFPTETMPGDATTLTWHGAPIPATSANRNRADIDFTGSVMPPPEAVAGTYVGPDGTLVKVAPLSDEDRRTFVRWIDLGCPIDLDADSVTSNSRGAGWLGDDQPPTMTLTYPARGRNAAISRLLVGMHDHESGLDMSSFSVVADFPVDDVPAGGNLADRFTATAQGVWEWRLGRPITHLEAGRLVVSVRDRDGNLSRIDRTLSVGRP